MKAVLSALALAALTLCPSAAPAADVEELEKLLHQSFGHTERMCNAMERINQEIALHPDEDKLLELRISAFGALGDPYSAKPDVDTLADRHPESPYFQMQKCIVDEVTGTGLEESRLCFQRVADLCERTGRTGDDADEYLLALTLADSPQAAEVKNRALARLPATPGDSYLREMLTHFTREMVVRKVDRSTVYNPCTRNR